MIFLFLSGICAQDMKMDTLFGTWNFSFLNYVKVYNHVDQETLAVLKEKMSKKHSAQAQGSQLILHKDSTFLMYQYDDNQIDTSAGTWTLIAEHNQSYLKLKDKNTSKKIRIKKINGLELVLIFQSRETIYESYWYYQY